MRTVAALAAVALYVTPAAADIVGRGTVIDGDTINIRGERIRLHGIDAPESGQICHAGEGAVCPVRIWKRQSPWSAMNRRS